MEMPYLSMALDARSPVTLTIRAGLGMVRKQSRVTTDAVGCDDPSAQGCGTYVHRGVEKRKGKAMVGSVHSLHDPFSHRVVRDMAVVADSDVMMIALLPVL